MSASGVGRIYNAIFIFYALAGVVRRLGPAQDIIKN